MSRQIDLEHISFPVYCLGHREPLVDNGVIYYVSGENVNEEDEEYRLSILDDKNVEGTSLAQRRLLLASNGVHLKRITKAVFFLGDFLKTAKASNWFIDSLGLLFKYVKTRKVRLVYKKITKILKLPQGGTIVEVEGIPGRFKTLFVSSSTKDYAGILIDKHTFILYGLYDKKYKDSYRMI